MASISPYSSALSRKEVLHLLRRSGMSYTQAEVDALVGVNVGTAVDSILIKSVAEPSPPVNTSAATFHNREEIGSPTLSPFYNLYFKNWWVMQCIESDYQARERMTFFISTLFTNSDTKINYAFPSYHQNALFRKYALGNFKTLAKKMCRDYAMSVFLDGWTNQAGSPNENYAREFLELFTLGKGPEIGLGNYTTYTEDDVREAARVLTGFIPSGFLTDAEIAAYGLNILTDPDTGLYMSEIVPFLHDAGTKTFSSAFGGTSISTGINTVANVENELNSFINMIFSEDALSLNVCRKLYRFFCYYDITAEIETDIIAPLAATFRASNYEFLPVLQQLLKSQHFFDADDALTSNNSIGGIIKSPLELVAGTFKYFNIDYGTIPNWSTIHDNLTVLNYVLENTDMKLNNPPDVAGYDAYHQGPLYNRNWISASSLVNRYGAFEYLTIGIPVGTFLLKLDTVQFVRYSGNFSTPSDPYNIVDTLVNDLFPQGVDATKRETLRNFLVDISEPSYYWSDAWSAYVSSGVDSTIHLRLNNLFNAILQSPEFQLA